MTESTKELRRELYIVWHNLPVEPKNRQLRRVIDGSRLILQEWEDRHNGGLLPDWLLRAGYYIGRIGDLLAGRRMRRPEEAETAGLLRQARTELLKRVQT